MDRVGGTYEDYLALREDARAFDDVLLWMEAEAKADRIRELEAKRDELVRRAQQGGR